jgi:hypothetical protein
VVGPCKYDDEPAGSGATFLVQTRPVPVSAQSKV